MAKFQMKKKSLIKEIACKSCGKTFKTNSESKLCFDCRKIMAKFEPFERYAEKYDEWLIKISLLMNQSFRP